MNVVSVKILGYKKSQRYPVWRALQAARSELEKEFPEGLRLEVQEIAAVDEILRYTPVIAFPSLVINEKLACAGYAPSRGEIMEWLKSAIAEDAG